MNPNTDYLKENLAPIRLPGDFASFGIGDMVSFCALGILLGLLIAWLIRPLFNKRQSPEAVLKSKIVALRNQSEEARWFGLCQLAEANGVALEEDEHKALYDPHASPQFAPLEERLLAAARDRKSTKATKQRQEVLS